MEVIIIGEGAVGLLLAQGLKQAGIKATVYEHQITNPREWGMSLHYRNDAIAKILPNELQQRIKEAWCDPHSDLATDNYIPQYAGHTGELLFATPAPDETRLSRSKMRSLFGEGIDIRYGKRLVSISQCDKGVTAIFQDGTSASGSLIVGCDGAKSVTRELLVGTKESQLSNIDGIHNFNFVCKFPAHVAKLIRAKHPIGFNSYSKQGCVFWVSIQDIPDPSDPADWSFQIFFSWLGAPFRQDFGTQSERIRFLRAKAPKYAEPWRSILSNIPDEANFTTDHVGLWTPANWSDVPLEGRVTLAGDAAHSMSPYRGGKALSCGVKDAAAIVEHLVAAEHNDGGWFKAVQQYEQEMRERALKEFPLSEAAARIAHDFNQMTDQSLAVETSQIGLKPRRPTEYRTRVDSVFS